MKTVEPGRLRGEAARVSQATAFFDLPISVSGSTPMMDVIVSGVIGRMAAAKATARSHRRKRGNQSLAARQVCISRTTLWRIMSQAERFDDPA